AGGEAYRRLVEEVFLPHFGNPFLNALQDSAVCPAEGEQIAVTTDSFVVKPRFFPGGDIGRLAVCGTVNDLAMSGAIPRYLTVGMIIENGFPLEELERICASAARAAAEAGVTVVTGDTKVVESGGADGIYINTAGVGVFPPDCPPLPGKIREGDCILLSGGLAEHGLAVLAARENLDFDPPLQSDVAPLNHLTAALRRAAPDVRALRDPTRGGAAVTLNEWAADSGLDIVLEEEALPLKPAARAACELLGLDPLTIANEGKFLAALPAGQAEAALAALRPYPLAADAAVIGRVHAGSGQVFCQNAFGGRRMVAAPQGEQLPRIC
ncbi:MAG: hydrogenase expression/formation protein HypE, partial [Firmicutes bacterium]|nr:hydrogenase expression/formation protein HypE [Bacillota bacterium]